MVPAVNNNDIALDGFATNIVRASKQLLVKILT